MDKPETDDEEEENWKDASPLTPTYSPTDLPRKFPQDQKPLKTVEVDVHEFYPASSGSLEDVIIADISPTSLDMKIAARYTHDMTTGIEKVAPKVKLKNEPSLEKPPEPQPVHKRLDPEKRKELKRTDSTEKKSTPKEPLTKREELDKAVKKKIPKKQDTDADVKPTRKRIDEVEEPPESSKKTPTTPEDSKKEEDAPRTKEQRKLQKEQACIERVTEYLTRHNVLVYSDYSQESILQPPQDAKEQRIRPSTLEELDKARPAEGVDDRSTQRIEDSKITPEESTKTPSTVVSDKPWTAERLSVTVAESKNALTPEDATQPKRRSSMRKKTFSRESSRESLLDETKKEVRIQENVEEIFFEEPSEQISGILPEVQLVKARIITAEEAAANRAEEVARVEVQSPPEVVVFVDSIRVRSGRVPSPETVDTSHLQLVNLAKSTSENTLVDQVEEENRVSERNLKAEILLDLSKVPDVGEVLGKAAEGERKLSRTGSEGSKRGELRRIKDRDGFKIGSLAQPDQPELTVLLEAGVTERRRAADEEREGRVLEDGSERIAKSPEEPGKGDSPQQPDEKVEELEHPSRRTADSVKCPKPDDKESRKEEDPARRSQESRDYDRTPWQQRRPVLEEVSTKPADDAVISKEHSLEYQSQTLESQRGLGSSSLEDLLKTIPDTWSAIRGDRVEHSFKETQYSPKEKQDAATQTEQETKSTQCSPEQSVSPSEISKDSPLRRYYSPRREVETQTQGENKSVQCSLDDFGGLSKTPDLENSFDSPSRSEKSQVKESKSIQCIPEDISTSPGKSVGDQSSGVQKSPRKEAEVQTYQESKAVQCSDDEILEAECSAGGYRARFQSRPASYASQKTESSPSSGCSSPCKLPTVAFAEDRADMTVTQREHDGNVNWSKHWGPERLVEIYREPKTSLGLSIVGGKVDLHNGSSSKSQNISGIFIKNVLPNSPAGRTGELKVGDRIIEVDGVDLRHSTHERAVEVIQAAGNPVCLLVQSLVHLNENEGGQSEDSGSRLGRRQSTKNRVPTSGVAPGTPTYRQAVSPVTSARSTTPEVIQGRVEEEEKQSSSRSDFRRQSTRASDGAGSSARRSSMKKSIRKKAPSPPSNPGILREVSEEKEDNAAKPEDKTPRRKYSSDESSDEDTRELEGNIYTKAGMEISRKSAGNVKRTKQEIEADPEKEDEFGYTNMKVQKKYHGLGNKVLLVKVDKDRRGLGISLAGHRDRNRMAVFICGLNPRGSAYKGGELLVGDEILEVNGCVLQGRCHLNASALIKGMAGTCFKVVVVRRSKSIDDIAVKPISQFPPALDDSEMFSQYKGVRNVPVKKGQYGLGIMIIEGKHAEVGQGIFISDIQEGSAAEQAGLQVGDLILAVNLDCLLGSTYDEATSLLKKAEGVVTLTVCNPNQSKVAKEEEDRAKGILPTPEPEKPKEPEKPPEPEPPQDPKDCKIVAGRDTVIEFQKEKDKGIGFTIAGGSDTPCKGVFIIEVFPDGAAGKDGRLQSGDQILDMCTHSFKEIEHEKAHATVLKVTGTITMTVHRQEKPEEEIEVELQKKSGKGAGLCLTGYKSGKGAYVSDLLPGGSALESGKICKGDRVVAVGGQDVREAPVEDIAVHVKVSNPVQLKLARFKSAKQ